MLELISRLRVPQRNRGIAQLVEQRSPKPRAEGSSPSAPAIAESRMTRPFPVQSCGYYFVTIGLRCRLFVVYFEAILVIGVKMLSNVLAASSSIFFIGWV